MKKTFIASLILLSVCKSLFAASAGHQDDYLVLLVPFLFLTIVWASYEVKKKVRERKEAKQHPTETNTAEHSLE